MKTSTETTKISEAMAACVDIVTNADKDRSNPFFNSEYATLESVIGAIKPALTKNKLFVFQAPSVTETKKVLITRINHSSGEFFEFETPLITTKEDMQQLGSAITYARRYALAAAFCVTQADDDGNAASDTKTANKPATKQTEKPKTQLKGDPKDYVVKVGQKYKGMIFKDMLPNEIEGYIDYLEKGAVDKNKPLSGDWAEFVEVGYKYLEQIGHFPPPLENGAIT